MDGNSAYEVMQSDIFLRLSAGFALFTLLGAIAATVFALSHAESPAATTGASGEPAPWPLIVGTFRDSFLLTMLYFAEVLLGRSSYFHAVASGPGSSPWLWASILEPYAILALIVFGAIITGRRIMILSRWLRARGAA